MPSCKIRIFENFVVFSFQVCGCADEKQKESEGGENAAYHIKLILFTNQQLARHGTSLNGIFGRCSQLSGAYTTPSAPSTTWIEYA